MYFKVGLINLSNRGEGFDSSDEYSIESDEDSTMTSIITQWIEKQVSEKDDIKDNQSLNGNIVLLSSEYRSKQFDNLMFHSNDESNVLEDLGNMAETIGCLSNIIVILYDTSNPYRQKAIVRMIKGIERQKMSSDFYKSVDMILLAVDENAEKELDVIRNVLKDGNEDIYQSLQILSLTRDLQLIKDVLREAEYGAIVTKATVSVDIFPKLVKSVYSKLCGSSNSDNIRIQHHTLKDNRLNIYTSDLVQENDLENDDSHEISDGMSGSEESKTQESNDREMDTKDVSDEQYVSDDNRLESINKHMDESLLDDESEDNSGIIESENHDSNSKADVQDDNMTADNTNSKDDNISEEQIQQQSTEEEEVKGGIKESQTVDTEQATSIEKTSSDDTEDRVSELLKQCIAEKVKSTVEAGESMLADIEARQDDVLLNPESQMPILEFGRDASNLLTNAKEVFEEQSVSDLVENDIDTQFIETTKNTVLKTLNDGILRLYDIQLQSLREYFGRKYEKVIEKLENEDEDIEMDEEVFNKRRKEKDAILVEEAKKTTEGFLTAATNAVPIIVQNGELKDFASTYSYEKALDGLIRDMMHASTSSQNHDAEWASATVESDGEDESDTLSSRSRTRGPVKWYEKIAARALVFGVNYAQGWLAYQGIKKAAAERDRLQPKFPLF